MLLNNLLEPDNFRLNLVAPSTSLTMALHPKVSWLWALSTCQLGAACVMTNSTHTSQRLVHRGFLIMYRYFRLRNIWVTRLSRLWLVIINRLPLAAVYGTLVWPWLHNFLTTVDTDASIRPAWFFEIVNFLGLVWFIYRDEWVSSRLWRRWGVYFFRCLNWVYRFRPLREHGLRSSVLHNHILQILVFSPQLLYLIRDEVQWISHLSF